jgi:uncharacterized membrane protein YraQ (UPF0718 family)
MSPIVEMIGRMLSSGWIDLLDYLAAHVLLCLLPAFVIAGYMSVMIPKEAVTRYLGPRASKWTSYPAAAIGGFLLAVCSCTILPLFAGIWRRGAGLGAAITFLFVGPAVNILAVAYTGAAIGMDIALARIGLSILFGIGIGLIMAWLFRSEERIRAMEMEDHGMFAQEVRMRPVIWILFMLLIAVLMIGTLQVELLTKVWFELPLKLKIPDGLLSALVDLNLTPQGVLLILLILLIMPIAHLGLENVLQRFNHWTYLTIVLFTLTLLLAAPGMEQDSIKINLTGRFLGEVILLLSISVVAIRSFSRQEIAEWLWETWKFVKQIFPLLILGVLLSGMVKAILPAEWVRSLAGHNTLWANLIGVLFGVFMYFPTLVEVPIARMFLDLGMHRGPLLAYLLADPELSLQSILVTGRILGRQKTLVYVSLVSIFSTLAGYVFGLFMALL